MHQPRHSYQHSRKITLLEGAAQSTNLSTTLSRVLEHTSCMHGLHSSPAPTSRPSSKHHILNTVGRAAATRVVPKPTSILNEPHMFCKSSFHGSPSSHAERAFNRLQPYRNRKVNPRSFRLFSLSKIQGRRDMPDDPTRIYTTLVASQRPVFFIYSHFLHAFVHVVLRALVAITKLGTV